MKESTQMEPMPIRPGTVLHWTKVKGASPAEYALRIRDDLVAGLNWSKKYGSLATGESAHGRWTFKRTGFFATSVTVRREGDERDLAVFLPNWKGDGRVVFDGSQTLTWTSTSFWKANYTLIDPSSGQTVLTMKADSSITPNRTEIVVGPHTLAPEKLALLSVLAMYVGVLASSDADDGATAALLAAVISC